MSENEIRKKKKKKKSLFNNSTVFLQNRLDQRLQPDIYFCRDDTVIQQLISILRFCPFPLVA